MVLIFQTCIRISLLASKKKLKKIFQLGIHVFHNSAENSKDPWNHVTVESLDCGRTRTIKWFSLFRSYRWNLSWNVIGQEEPVRKYLSEMGCNIEDLDRYSLKPKTWSSLNWINNRSFKIELRALVRLTPKLTTKISAQVLIESNEVWHYWVPELELRIKEF